MIATKKVCDPRMDTVLIFDWDDTLLPTTWLQKSNLLQEEPRKQTDEQRDILDGISTSVITLLTEAQKYATVKIVTNAQKGWVQSSCREFMPRCSALIESVPIFSARTTYEWLYPDKPYMWKILAFQIVTINYSQVISIGDTDAERLAALELHDSLRIKTIKLEEMPAIETIARQLKMLSSLLGPIVVFEENMDVFYDLEASSE